MPILLLKGAVLMHKLYDKLPPEHLSPEQWKAKWISFFNDALVDGCLNAKISSMVSTISSLVSLTRGKTISKIFAEIEIQKQKEIRDALKNIDIDDEEAYDTEYINILAIFTVGQMGRDKDGVTRPITQKDVVDYVNGYRVPE